MAGILEFLLDYIEFQRKQPVRVYTSDSSHVGGCNGCTAQGQVWVMTFGGLLQVRVCRSCKNELQRRLK